MNSESERDRDMEMVKLACERLGEHFDTVHIFTTRHETGNEDGTVNVTYGIGNWFARYGQVQEWIIRCDERTRRFVQQEE